MAWLTNYQWKSKFTISFYDYTTTTIISATMLIRSSFVLTSFTLLKVLFVVVVCLCVHLIKGNQRWCRQVAQVKFCENKQLCSMIEQFLLTMHPIQTSVPCLSKNFRRVWMQMMHPVIHYHYTKDNILFFLRNLRFERTFYTAALHVFSLFWLQNLLTTTIMWWLGHLLDFC